MNHFNAQKLILLVVLRIVSQLYIQQILLFFRVSGQYDNANEKIVLNDELQDYEHMKSESIDLDDTRLVEWGFDPIDQTHWDQQTQN